MADRDCDYIARKRCEHILFLMAGSGEERKRLKEEYLHCIEVEKKLCEEEKR